MRASARSVLVVPALVVPLALASLVFAGAAQAGRVQSQLANKVRSPQAEAAFHKCMGQMKKPYAGGKVPTAAMDKFRAQCDQQAGQ